MSMNRRSFVQTTFAAGIGLMSGAALPGTGTASARPTRGKQAITDRIAFGAWINDVRTEPLPFDSWPPVILDDTAERSIIATMELQARSGYNMLDLFGLFAAWG